jgi:hypothetical protein
MRGPTVACALWQLRAPRNGDPGLLAAASARQVERPRSIWRAGLGEMPPAIAAALGLEVEMARRRIRRFNEGVAALEEHHHSAGCNGCFQYQQWRWRHRADAGIRAFEACDNAECGGGSNEEDGLR